MNIPHPFVGPDLTRLRQRAGVWLKALRQEAGLSQDQLAAAVGEEVYTLIAQLEAGVGRITPDCYGRWAWALGVEVGWFSNTVMSYYDPVLHRLLFDEAPANDAHLH